MVLDRHAFLCYAQLTHKCAWIMAVHQTYKQSDLEKRLKLLKSQLYGRQEKLSFDSTRDRDVTSDPSIPLGTGKVERRVRNWKLNNLASNIQHQTSNQDVTYLRQDLLKILILATLAFAVEFGIYFGRGVI